MWFIKVSKKVLYNYNILSYNYNILSRYQKSSPGNAWFHVTVSSTLINVSLLVTAL